MEACRSDGYQCPVSTTFAYYNTDVTPDIRDDLVAELNPTFVGELDVSHEFTIQLSSGTIDDTWFIFLFYPYNGDMRMPDIEKCTGAAYQLCLVFPKQFLVVL